MLKKLIILITLIFMGLTGCSTTPSFQSSRSRDVINSEDTTPVYISSERNLKSIRLQKESQGADVAGNEPGDIWERIRSGLTLKTHADNKVVKEKIAWYARNQEYLDRVADRATPYIFHIVEQIEKRGMPIEIALLPIVESAYHPYAYSRSHAAGLWQFIPGTGKIFGLKQNWWYDGRRDVVEATRAALDYLQKLHAQFGDWQLAVAAYNTGERNIERAIARNTQAKKKTDFFSLTVHKETRGYVPSLLAIAEIVANPAKYNLKLKPIPNEQYFTQVDTGGQIDLSTVASLTGMSMDEIYTLNPAFSRWATDPDGPHSLLVPLAKEQMLVTGLSTLPADQRVAWNQHVVEKGDTLGAIADKYKTSVAMLKETNNLKGNLIRVGQALMIPGSKMPRQGVSPPLAHQQQVAAKLPSGDKQVYVVRAGDNPWAISRKMGVNLKDLLAWNNLNAKSTLRPGQKLNLWNKSAPVSKPATVAKSSGPDYSKDAQGQIKYTVKKGDTLWNISQAFGVTVAQLQQWNKLSAGKPLQPGQTLLLMNAPALAAADA